jgi:general secretion pathway protein D
MIMTVLNQLKLAGCLIFVCFSPLFPSTIANQPLSNDEVPGVRLTSTIELERLIDLAAQINSVEIEYPTGSFRNKSMTFRLTHELTPTELWRLCLQSLHASSHTIIRLDGERGLYSVVTLSRAAAEVLPSTELELDDLMPGYQSIIVPLSRVQPEEMQNRVSAIVKPSESITVEAVEGISGLVVRGVIERVTVVVDLVHRIDSKSIETGMFSVEVVNRPAIDVIAEVNVIINALSLHINDSMASTLIASPDGRSVRVFGPVSEIERVRTLIAEADQIPALETRIFDPRGYPLETVAQFIETMAKDLSTRGSGELWRVAQDTLTNTLIVTATPTELAQVEIALQRLAEIPPDSQRIIRMIEVHNREASKVRDIVGQLLSARFLSTSASDPQMISADERGSDLRTIDERSVGFMTQNTGQETRSDLELAVDEEMNVIIATGPPRRIDQVEQLVQDLDVRQPQVQLEVILLSLSESETRDLGVELAGNIDTGDTLFGLASLFGLSSVSPSDTSAQASGNGGSVVILSPGDFSAVIRAVETVNDGRSLSMPSVVVNNNETATLNSTTTQPYLTTTITDGGNRTESRGGAASAGTTIDVSPQIAAADQIVLDYSFTLSSFVGESSSDGVEPPTQQTSLTSVVTIPDGYTIALGGIENTSLGDSLTKTPLLADLPLIGELFQSQSDSTSRSRFFVFIRATVMRSQSFEYLKYISEDLADEAGIDDGWPEVEPRIIR